MIFTPAQKTTLNNYINADPTLSALPNNSDSWTTIAAALNAESSPAFWVWRTAVSQTEYVTATSDIGTVFDWGSASGNYIARSQGERDAWREIFADTGTVNPSNVNIQAAFANIFSGAGAGAVNNRNHLVAVSRRKASIVEKLLATGTGSTASPGTMAVEGPVSMNDIQRIRE